MVEVKRKDNESYESMMRRFGRKIMQSQVLRRARKMRFHAKNESKNIRRTKAVKRAEMREERQELERQGKISYNNFGPMNQRGRGRR